MDKKHGKKLRSGLRCDLVFCDIEMPRINGLELLQQMQKDANLEHIPVAILSSRGAQKHKLIAAELGASAYLVKPYVEKDLIDSAKRMINGEVLLSGSTKKPSRPKAHKITPSSIAQNAKTTIERQFKDSKMVLIIDDSVVVRENAVGDFSKSRISGRTG